MNRVDQAILDLSELAGERMQRELNRTADLAHAPADRIELTIRALRFCLGTLMAELYLHHIDQSPPPDNLSLMALGLFLGAYEHGDDPAEVWKVCMSWAGAMMETEKPDVAQ